MPEISSEPRNEDEYVASYLYAREMFPLQRELVRRDLELRTNWTLLQAQRSGNVHVRAVAQPLQFTGDDAVDMSKTYSVLLIADDIPPGKKFLDVYDVTIGPNPLAAVVRDAMGARSLADTDLALIQENVTRLTIDEGNFDADVAEADATRDLLGKKIGEAISFTNKQIKRTESELNITKGERRKLKEQLPGILNRVDNAESAHKKARKRHKQLNNQLVASKIRDFATVALTNNIAGLVQAQGFSDTQKSNDIIDEIKKNTNNENDADAKAKLEEKLKNATTAQQNLTAAIDAHRKAKFAVEEATAKSKELSRAETDKKILAKTKESNAEAASKKQEDQEKRLEKANAALEVADDGEADKQRLDAEKAWMLIRNQVPELETKIELEKKKLEELKEKIGYSG